MSAKTRKCRKHDPEPDGGLLEQIRGDVRCRNCGMEGRYSNGQRKFGRPRRVIWFTRRALERPIP